MAAFLIKLGSRTIETDAGAVEIGTRSTCTVLLRDPVASERHARIARRGSEFTVEDSGTATGTWLNGVQVTGQGVLATGDVLIVGCTRLLVQIDPVKGTLQLEVKEQSFFFEPSKKRKGESGGFQVGGDAEAWVRDEVLFGRFRPLSRANWIAAGAALLFVLVLSLASGREAVLQPGALAAGHARLFELDALPPSATKAHVADSNVAREQGCSACHDTLGGTPAERCGSCHHAELLRENHPFYGDRSDAPATRGIELDEDVCASCHMDHQGLEPSAGTFVPAAGSLEQSCSRCHAQPPQEIPITRKPKELEVVPHELAYDSFPHSSHADVSCNVCHARTEDDGGSDQDRDFAPVRFARCMDCHSADDAPSKENLWARNPVLAEFSDRVEPEHRVRLRWHGSQTAENGASRCVQCHADTHEKALRTVDTDEADRLSFRLERRGHGDLFEAHTVVTDAQGRERACGECHADEIPLQAGQQLDGTFWHELHLATVRPSGGDAGAAALTVACAKCHAETKDSMHLAGAPAESALYEGAPLASCVECHHEKVERDGGEELRPLLVEVLPSMERQTRTRTDFPHAPHVRARPSAASDDPLAAGCLACHSFEAGALSFQATPTTDPAIASTCLPCHEDHGNVAGPDAACALCHPSDAQDQPDPIWTGTPTLRMRSDTPGFSHWSRGHAPTMDSGDCAQCHGGVEVAQRVRDVPIPSEADERCFECHLQERFHWRGAPAQAASAR